MRDPGIKIYGIDPLKRLLDSATQDSAKYFLTQIVTSCGPIIKEAFKAGAPVEDGVLEESIVEQVEGDGFQMKAMYGPQLGIFWGSLQEFGWQQKGHVKTVKEKGKRKVRIRLSPDGRKVPGSHWMQNSWEGIKDKVLDQTIAEAQNIPKYLEERRGY